MRRKCLARVFEVVAGRNALRKVQKIERLPLKTNKSSHIALAAKRPPCFW